MKVENISKVKELIDLWGCCKNLKGELSRMGNFTISSDGIHFNIPDSIDSPLKESMIETLNDIIENLESQIKEL